MKTILAFFCLLLPACSFADSLGRLFFTPKERAVMDSLSRHHGNTVILQGGNPESRGTVEKKGGGKTVWIDGVPSHVEPGKKK